MSDVIMRMPVPVDRWKNYPADMKDILYKDFMDKYRFESDYDRAMARGVWEKTCMDRFPDLLKKARETAFKQANSTNLANIKGHGPKGMRKEVWDGLVDIWMTPEWQKKSEAGRNNRAALPDCMLHTGGSISFGQHKKRMEAELKHPVSFRDLYHRVHKKKDGEYVSQRSRDFIDLYDNAMSEKYGEDSSTYPLIDPEVWVDAAGSNKKGRVHGLGHSLDIGINGSTPSSSTSATGPSHTASSTQGDITSTVNAAMTSFVQTQLVPMLVPILSLVPGFDASKLTSQEPSQGAPSREGHENDEQDDDINLD